MSYQVHKTLFLNENRVLLEIKQEIFLCVVDFCRGNGILNYDPDRSVNKQANASTAPRQRLGDAADTSSSISS